MPEKGSFGCLNVFSSKTNILIDGSFFILFVCLFVCLFALFLFISGYLWWKMILLFGAKTKKKWVKTHGLHWS